MISKKSDTFENLENLDDNDRYHTLNSKVKPLAQNYQSWRKKRVSAIKALE